MKNNGGINALHTELLSFSLKMTYFIIMKWKEITVSNNKGSPKYKIRTEYCLCLETQL